MSPGMTDDQMRSDSEGRTVTDQNAETGTRTNEEKTMFRTDIEWP